MERKAMEQERLVYLTYLHQEGYLDGQSYEVFKREPLTHHQDPYKSYMDYIALPKGEQKRRNVKTYITMKKVQLTKEEYAEIQSISKIYRILRSASEGGIEEDQSKLIEKNCRYIQYIPNPSERLQEEAVLRCKKGLSYIQNPTPDLYQKAFAKYGEEVNKYLK